MTNAIQQHNLSKLDIFTPNILYPALPRLAHGEYPVMGGVATSTYRSGIAATRLLMAQWSTSPILGRGETLFTASSLTGTLRCCESVSGGTRS
jgi:hypothetical protein